MNSHLRPEPTTMPADNPYPDHSDPYGRRIGSSAAPASPEPTDPRVIRSQAYAEGLAAGRAEAAPATIATIEDVRHLAKMSRAQGRVDGIREERARVEALYARHFGATFQTCATAAAKRTAASLLTAIRSGEVAP